MSDNIMKGMVPLMGVVMIAGVLQTLLAKPTEAAPVKGHIVINTLPTGATISVNSNVVGTSPITVDVDAGSYVILIQLSGYNDSTTTVNVVAGETYTLNASLTELSSGRLPIDIVWS